VTRRHLPPSTTTAQIDCNHYLFALLGSREDADDALHETFVQLVRSRRRLALVTNLAGYVFKTARNEAFRLSARRSRSGQPGCTSEPEAWFCRPTTNASDALEIAESIAKGLSQLVMEQREVVELHIYSGLAFREIAELLDLPPGTVATRYRAAIAAMRQSLSPRSCRELD